MDFTILVIVDASSRYCFKDVQKISGVRDTLICGRRESHGRFPGVLVQESLFKSVLDYCADSSTASYYSRFHAVVEGFVYEI